MSSSSDSRGRAAKIQSDSTDDSGATDEQKLLRQKLLRMILQNEALRRKKPK